MTAGLSTSSRTSVVRLCSVLCDIVVESRCWPSNVNSSSSRRSVGPGAARVSELTELLGVSDMTIRRDLDVLASAGLVDKVHGGATVSTRLSANEPGFEAKSHQQIEEKEAIAARRGRSWSPARRSG